jgi:hypothetical protein
MLVVVLPEDVAVLAGCIAHRCASMWPVIRHDLCVLFWSRLYTRGTYLPCLLVISSFASKHRMISLSFVRVSSQACKSIMNCSLGCGSSISVSENCLVRYLCY